jgi:hypothetical protein
MVLFMQAVKGGVTAPHQEPLFSILHITRKPFSALLQGIREAGTASRHYAIMILASECGDE